MAVLDIPNDVPAIVPAGEIEAMNPAVVVADLALARKASPFAQAADALLQGGYTVIPVVPRDKAPGEFRGSIEHGSWAMMNGWNDYAHSKPSDASIARWKTWPDANIGVVLGGDHNGYAVIAIDFDTDDDDELELLSSSIPPSPMKKLGSRGFTAFYRGSKDLKTKRYMVPAPTADKPNAKRTILEILTGNAPRQTVMPPSMHPHGRNYEYVGNGVVPISRLPVLTNDHIEVLEDNASHIGWNGDDVARPDRATRGSPVDDDNIWRETNNIAIDNLDMWVGSLGLPKLKRHGNGSWEAIPSFRPSNSGTSLMQRKSNLKFHRSGIKDMGTDDGYTPIDVVVAAFSWDFDSAFHWLRGKLGIKDPDDSFFQLPIPPMTLTETDDGSLIDTNTGAVIEAEPENVLLEVPDHLTRIPGLLGEMIDFTEASALYPNRSLSMAANIASLSTIIGRKIATPKRGALNLYVLALAPTGGGKQHGITAARTFLREAGAEKHIGTGDYMSQSAFYNRMKKQPLTFSATDEFGFFLQRLNANNAGAWDVGLKKVMLEVWGANFDIIMSSGTAAEDGVPIEAPAMTIYGVSTPDMFYKAVQGADSVNGMLNRFLLIATGVRSEEADPMRFLSEMPAGLVRKLDRAYRVLRPPRLRLLGEDEPDDDDIDPGDIKLIVPWGVGAHEVYKAFSKECRTRGDSNAEIAPFFARSAEIALRLATIRAVGCDLDYPEVSAADMQWGIDLARWSAERMADDAGDLVSDTPYTAINSRILAKMKQARGIPTKERDLQRASGIGGDAFKKHLKDLQDMGRILPVEITTRGQKSKAWKLVANDNAPLPKKPAKKKAT